MVFRKSTGFVVVLRPCWKLPRWPNLRCSRFTEEVHQPVQTQSIFQRSHVDMSRLTLVAVVECGGTYMQGGSGVFFRKKLVIVL